MPINSSKLKARLAARAKRVKSLKFQRGFSLLFLVAIVAVIGGIVLLFMSISGVNRSGEIPKGENTQDQQVADLEKLSSSDEISDIEGDLNSTSLDNLNSEDKIVEEAAQGL